MSSAARAGPNGNAIASAATSAAISLQTDNGAVVEHGVERVGQERILDLSGDASSGGHGFAVVQVRVRRPVDEEVRTRDDSGRNLHDVEAGVGRDDRLDTERAEEPFRSANLPADAHD